MKILYRQVYKELVFYLFLGIVVINTLIMVEKLIRVSKVISGIAGPLDMIRIILLIQPQMLTITIPVAFLTAILLTYGRLNMDNELVAVSASGVSLTKVSMPAVRMGIVLMIIALLVTVIIAPYGNKRLRKEVNHLLKTGISKKIEEETFTDLGNIVLYSGRKDGQILKDVFVYIKSKEAVVTAKRAFVRTDSQEVIMELQDGLMSIVKGDKKIDIYFGRYKLSGIAIKGLSKKAGELMPHQLLAEAKEVDKKKALKYIMEFYRRFTYPLLSIVIGLIGPRLSLLAGRTGRFGGLTSGVLFLVSYYILSVYFEGLVEAERLAPEIGMVLPVFLGITGGIIVFIRMDKR
ncbi:MAG: LptF/LptG family permease [Thermodesulfovibrionales bacterium]